MLPTHMTAILWHSAPWAPCAFTHCSDRGALVKWGILVVFLLLLLREPAPSCESLTLPTHTAALPLPQHTRADSCVLYSRSLALSLSRCLRAPCTGCCRREGQHRGSQQRRCAGPGPGPGGSRRGYPGVVLRSLSSYLAVTHAAVSVFFRGCCARSG